METKPNEIDINDIYRKTFNRIAKWHNEVPDMPEAERVQSLHVLTSLIVQEVGEKLSEKFGLPVSQSISMSDELRDRVNEIKKSDGRFLTGEGNLKKMLDKESFID